MKATDKKHSDSSYSVPTGARCDDCNRILSDDERLKNIIANEKQDGNTILCVKCDGSLGPWQVGKRLPYVVAYAAPPYSLDLTTIVSRGHETGGQDWPAISKEEREANARLIAAAPIGYELAQAVLNQMQDGIDRMDYIQKKAADFIAKAEK